MNHILRVMDGLGYGVGEGGGHCYGTGNGYGCDYSRGTGDGAGYGYGYGNGGVGDGDGYGFAEGSADGLDGVPVGLPVTNDIRRTSRVFRCPGCIGGFECSIHGRRL